MGFDHLFVTSELYGICATCRGDVTWHFGPLHEEIADLRANLEQAERDNESAFKTYRETRESLVQAEARVRRLEEALAWAMGEHPTDEFRPREPGEGAYWWRKELRKRMNPPSATT